VAKYFGESSLGKPTRLWPRATLLPPPRSRARQKRYSCARGTMRLRTLPVKHKDAEDENGVGLFIELREGGKTIATVAYSSDTGWFDGLESAYRDLAPDLLIANIGSIDPREILILDPEAEEDDYLYGQHIGLIGVTRLIEAARPKRAIIGELGEELAGLEEHLVKILGRHLAHLDTRIEPARLHERHHL